MALREPNRRRFLALAGAVSAGAASGCLSEPSEERVPEGDTGPRNVTLPAAHGPTLDATLYGSGDCGVVLVPQIDRDRESWESEAKRLAGDGRLVLALDEDPDNRADSVLGSIRYMRGERGVSDLVVIGASSGGKAALFANAKAEPGAVDGTATLSASGGVERASDLQGRLLFVISEREHEKYVRVGRELHAKAPEPKELVTYDGDEHAQRLFSGDNAGDVRRRLDAFVSEVCG
ncbi:dienelactone hydrolase family protein [Halegenticoccus soli]|uniref:hypothetical protein n=1 Tax=Halegenticoccus soli TaxID=1985678 RepID=UPI000C6EBC06|nr:hypothetical protein [Halegenticoccus soli]